MSDEVFLFEVDIPGDHEAYLEQRDWCNENLIPFHGAELRFGILTWYFGSEQDAVMFKLRWM